MNYTLNQLQIFLKVVQLESVTKAAEELNLTQPAVSIQLKNFQEQFDIPLTEIVGRRLYVTDFGKEIAESVEYILDKVHAIDYKTHAYKGQLFGKLKMSIVSTAKYVMPYFLTEFLQENANVELEMDVTNKTSVVDSLENNEVDFALVSIVPSTLNLEKIDLLPNKLYFVGKCSKDVTTKNPVDVFNSRPLIFREKGSGTRQTMEKFMAQHKIVPSKKMVLTSNEAVVQAIQAGLGNSIAPVIGIKHELLNNDLQIIPVKGLPIETTWSIVWMKGKKHSPIAQAYIDFIQANKDRIIKESFSWYNQFEDKR